MAKPRVFVSSTYYDLRHIRKGIEVFIQQLGFESVLFESGGIPFSHEKPLDESCYQEIASCHMLVLIIGGRYGSSASNDESNGTGEMMERQYEFYNSITKKEFETAHNQDIPVYIFVEKGVLAEYGTYKENRNNSSVHYAHVDSVNIFRLLDSIYDLRRNNLTQGFENLDDITAWLRDQWAGLFAEFLTREAGGTTLATLGKQLEDLSNITGVLKEYSERIIEGVVPTQYDKIVGDAAKNLKYKEAIDLINFSTLGRNLELGQGLGFDEIIKLLTTPSDSETLLRNVKAACNIAPKFYLSPIELNHLAGLVREKLGFPPLQVITKESKTT